MSSVFNALLQLYWRCVKSFGHLLNCFVTAGRYGNVTMKFRTTFIRELYCAYTLLIKLKINTIYTRPYHAVPFQQIQLIVGNVEVMECLRGGFSEFITSQINSLWCMLPTNSGLGLREIQMSGNLYTYRKRFKCLEVESRNCVPKIN